jgi:hypothetical protein
MASLRQERFHVCRLPRPGFTYLAAAVRPGGNADALPLRLLESRASSLCHMLGGTPAVHTTCPHSSPPCCHHQPSCAAMPATVAAAGATPYAVDVGKRGEPNGQEDVALLALVFRVFELLPLAVDAGLCGWVQSLARAGGNSFPAHRTDTHATDTAAAHQAATVGPIVPDLAGLGQRAPTAFTSAVLRALGVDPARTEPFADASLASMDGNDDPEYHHCVISSPARLLTEQAPPISQHTAVVQGDRCVCRESRLLHRKIVADHAHG